MFMLSFIDPAMVLSMFMSFIDPDVVLSMLMLSFIDPAIVLSMFMLSYIDPAIVLPMFMLQYIYKQTIKKPGQIHFHSKRTDTITILRVVRSPARIFMVQKLTVQEIFQISVASWHIYCKYFMEP
jgi:hypothetical protein